MEDLSTPKPLPARRVEPKSAAQIDGRIVRDTIKKQLENPTPINGESIDLTFEVIEAYNGPMKELEVISRRWFFGFTEAVLLYGVLETIARLVKSDECIQARFESDWRCIFLLPGDVLAYQHIGHVELIRSLLDSALVVGKIETVKTKNSQPEYWIDLLERALDAIGLVYVVCLNTGVGLVILDYSWAFEPKSLSLAKYNSLAETFERKWPSSYGREA